MSVELSIEYEARSTPRQQRRRGGTEEGGAARREAVAVDHHRRARTSHRVPHHGASPRGRCPALPLGRARGDMCCVRGFQLSSSFVSADENRQLFFYTR